MHCRKLIRQSRFDSLQFEYFVDSSSVLTTSALFACGWGGLMFRGFVWLFFEHTCGNNLHDRHISLCTFLQRTLGLFFSAPQFWFLFLTPFIYWTLYCFCKCKWYASYPILFVWLARTLWNIISNHKILFRLQRNRRVDTAYSLVDRKCHTEYHLLLSFSFWTATMMYSKINTILPSWFCCVKRSAVLLSQLGLLTHMACDYAFVLWALTC